MNFDATKQYVTQDGRPYRHNRVEPDHVYGVKGEIQTDAGEWVEVTHGMDGRWLNTLNKFRLNLVEVQQ
jgi:hypothetical protein